jgi:hypothetical protein
MLVFKGIEESFGDPVALNFSAGHILPKNPDTSHRKGPIGRQRMDLRSWMRV